MIRQHIKLADVLPDACLYFDGKIIVIFNKKWSLKIIQNHLDRENVSWQCDTFKIDSALCITLCQRFYRHKYICVCVTQEESHAVLFDVYKQFLNPDHVARQAAETKRKLNYSRYGGKKKERDWDEYVTLHN